MPKRRPESTYVRPETSIARRSLRAMNTPRGMTIRRTVAGSASGRTSVSAGTTTRARPNPTEPCTTAPTTTAANATRNAIYCQIG